MRLLNQPGSLNQLRPHYAWAVRHFLDWNQSKPINEENLRGYFFWLRNQYSPASIRLKKVGLKQWILKTHNERGNLQFRANVEALFKEIKVPKADVTIHESKILSERELQLVLKRLPVRYALIFEALYITGARVSEILSIKLHDCNILAEHVEVRILGKHSKEGTLIVSKALFQRIKETFKGRNFLFENSESKRPLTRQIVHRHFQAAGAEIGRGCWPHQLRHTRITNLLRFGKPLDAVSRFARHSDPGFTAKFYCHNRLSSREIIETSLEFLNVSN